MHQRALGIPIPRQLLLDEVTHIIVRLPNLAGGSCNFAETKHGPGTRAGYPSQFK
jgi:hypothetical protein